MPPNFALEIILWDRFGWGPEQTRSMTISQLRGLFLILEAQRNRGK